MKTKTKTIIAAVLLSVMSLQVNATIPKERWQGRIDSLNKKPVSELDRLQITDITELLTVDNPLQVGGDKITKLSVPLKGQKVPSKNSRLRAALIAEVLASDVITDVVLATSPTLVPPIIITTREMLPLPNVGDSGAYFFAPGESPDARYVPRKTSLSNAEALAMEVEKFGWEMIIWPTIVWAKGDTQPVATRPLYCVFTLAWKTAGPKMEIHQGDLHTVDQLAVEGTDYEKLYGWTARDEAGIEWSAAMFQCKRPFSKDTGATSILWPQLSR